MNISSMNVRKSVAVGVTLLVLAGAGLAGCKEDLDEARAALASTQKDRDALKVRVATLERELGAAKAALATPKSSPSGVAAPAPAGIHAGPAAVAGKTESRAGHGETIVPPPLAAKSYHQPKS